MELLDLIIKQCEYLRRINEKQYMCSSIRKNNQESAYYSGKIAACEDILNKLKEMTTR